MTINLTPQNAPRKTASLFMCIGLLTCLTACHTVEGVGTDIKHAGKALEQSAEDVRKGPPPHCSDPTHVQCHH